MAQRTVSAQQLATYLLACVDRVQINADDNSLAITQAARSLLRGIADGTIALQPVAAAQPEGNAIPGVAGSEGIVPAGATQG